MQLKRERDPSRSFRLSRNRKLRSGAHAPSRKTTNARGSSEDSPTVECKSWTRGECAAQGLELLQKADIILVKEPDVVDAIADHGDAFDAKTEGPAGPHFWIVSHILKYRRMYHAAAGDLQPFLAHLAQERAGEINLEARFGVAEVVG